MSAAPVLALVPASRYYCDVTGNTTMYVSSFIRIERGSGFSWGSMTLDITMCDFLLKKNREDQYFDVCCPETSSCASKPLLLRCNLVIPQCMYQVSLRLNEVQMGTHDFKYNKVPLFARKTGTINISMFAAPKLALVPENKNIIMSSFKSS